MGLGGFGTKVLGTGLDNWDAPPPSYGKFPTFSILPWNSEGRGQDGGCITHKEKYSRSGIAPNQDNWKLQLSWRQGCHQKNSCNKRCGSGFKEHFSNFYVTEVLHLQWSCIWRIPLDILYQSHGIYIDWLKMEKNKSNWMHVHTGCPKKNCEGG